MKRFFATVAAVGFVLLGAAVPAAAQQAFQLQPFEYDPDNLCDVTAQWQDGTIVLEKNCPTATNAAAGVEIISDLEGGSIAELTELNFEYENGGHCGAGAPRFNVVVDGQTYFLGCTQGTHTDLGNGWTRVEYTVTDFTAAGIPTTGTLEDLYIIFDEGTDTPPGGTIGTPGSVTIDNISINGDVVGDSAKPMTKDECKEGGWKNFQDPSFKNQGECVSWVVSNRGGRGRGVRR